TRCGVSWCGAGLPGRGRPRGAQRGKTGWHGGRRVRGDGSPGDLEGCSNLRHISGDVKLRTPVCPCGHAGLRPRYAAPDAQFPESDARMPPDATPSARRTYRYYDFIMAAFVTVLLCSNLVSAAKRVGLGPFTLGENVTVGPFVFGAGVIFFPISY